MKTLHDWSFFLIQICALVLLSAPLAQAQESGVSDSGTAPDAFAVRFETTEGSFVVDVYREWAPNAADRFLALVQDGYFDGNLFYWVEAVGDIRFGVNGTPDRRSQWTWPIATDPLQRLVRQGYIYFRPDNAATVGILTAEIDRRLANMDVVSFGRVTEETPDPALPAGSGVLAALDSAHMESRRITQFLRRYYSDGDAEMKEEYPDLDSIIRATVLDREVAVPVREEPAILTAAKGTLPLGSALVRVYRPGPRGLDPVDFNLRVDGETRADLKDGTIFELVLEAGRHTFSAGRQVQVFVQPPDPLASSAQRELSLDLQAGEIYYLRGRSLGSVLELYQVRPEYGAEEAEFNLPAEPKGDRN
jgi:peptidyl-prolyl cis-trans isomerase A (cyclophilin A)